MVADRDRVSILGGFSYRRAEKVYSQRLIREFIKVKITTKPLASIKKSKVTTG